MEEDDVYPPTHVTWPSLPGIPGGWKIYWKPQCNEDNRLHTDKERVPESVCRIAFNAVYVYWSVLASSSFVSEFEINIFYQFLSSYLGVIDSMEQKS